MSTIHTTGAVTLSLIAAAAIAPNTAAQGTWHNLGRGSAYAVSDDGNVVAGVGQNGPYRWTRSGGMMSIGSQETVAGMSGDGTTIVGNMKDSAGKQVAGRWTSVSGWIELGSLPLANPGGCPSLSSGYNTNGDGSVVVGLSWEGCSGRAFRWTSATGMVDLGHLGRNARANCVSADGMVIGGWDDSPRKASLWFADSRGQQLIIPSTPANPSQAGEVQGLTADGSIAVGWATTRNGLKAFRYFVNTGVYEEVADGRGMAITEDGDMIVGADGDPQQLPGARPQVSWVWTKEDGLVGLETFVQNQGVTVPSGPITTWAFDVDPYGRHITGRRGSFLSFDDEGFLVDLPASIRYGVGTATANTIDLSGSGTGQIGTTLTVTADNLALPAGWLLIGVNSTNIPFLGGAVLVDVTQPVLAVSLNPSGGSTSSNNLRIPNNTAYVGASLYMQALSPDPMAGAGWAFSNGLKTTIVN